MSVGAAARRRLGRLALAPDGRPRPEAPFGRGPLAARVLSLALRSGSEVGSRLSAPVAQRAAVAGGTLEWALRPGLRRRLAENLCHAVERPPDDPDVAALVRAEIVNEARRSADLLWALGRRGELVTSTEIIGREHLEAALGRGRGVILASLHVGGWEVATAIPHAVVPVPTSVVVDDDWIAWATDGVRRAAGLRLVPRTGSMLSAVRLLERGEALLVLGEDAAGATARRHRVRFLDAYALLPAGIPALARLSGSPVVPFSVLPLGPRRWRVAADAPLDAPERGSGRDGDARFLQQLADLWSEQLRAHPEHWAARFPIDWVEPKPRTD